MDQDDEYAEGLREVVERIEQAEYWSRVCQDLEVKGIAPEGSGAFLQWLADTMRDRVGLSTPH